MNSLVKHVTGMMVGLSALVISIVFVAAERVAIKSLDPSVSVRDLQVEVPTNPSTDPNLTTDEDISLFAHELAEHDDRFFSGWYSFEGSDGLRDAHSMLISLGRETDKAGREVVKPFAGVFTRFEEIGDQGFIENAWVKIEGDRVGFRTQKIKGFEFEFKGEFFKGRKTGADGETLLRGTFTQYRGKKKIASVSGNLQYYEPQCWH